MPPPRSSGERYRVRVAPLVPGGRPRWLTQAARSGIPDHLLYTSDRGRAGTWTLLCAGDLAEWHSQYRGSLAQREPVESASEPD